MRGPFAFPLALGLVACAPSLAPIQTAPGQEQSQPRSEEEALEEFSRRYGSCDTSQLGDFIGGRPEEETVNRMTATSGALVVRLIEPGEPISLDGNTGRLNVELDSDGTMRRFFCG